MDNSLRYIFIYRFSYLLTYYYSFRAHYNENMFDINWFYLLSPAIFSLWYSRFEVTWLLRDDSNSKTRVLFVYVLPEVLNGDFLYFLYLVNLEWNILQILTRNVIFYFNYSNWGELDSRSTFSSFSPNTCFAVKVISQKSRDLKARIPQWQDGGTK